MHSLSKEIPHSAFLAHTSLQENFSYLPQSLQGDLVLTLIKVRLNSLEELGVLGLD